jgi:hypothetical protein
MQEPKDTVRLGSVYIHKDSAAILKDIAVREQRTMARQAAYILEKWADEQK